MLCEACQQIFEPGGCTTTKKNGVIIPYFEHHKSGQAFKQAALDGCDLCFRLWHSLIPQKQADLCADATDYIAEDTDASSGAIICQIQQFVIPGCFNFRFERKSPGNGVPGVKWHFTTAPHRGTCQGSSIRLQS